MIIKLMLSRLSIPHLGTSIDNPYFEGMVNQIYPPKLRLNKANISDTEAPFLDLHLSVANGFVSSKIYDKRDDFDFDIVNFPFLDGDVPRRASYGKSRQRSGKGAIRKRFPLQKPRWEKNQTNNQDPVVQSIVSLTISLRHKFVKQISANVTNTLLFFVEKM